MVKNKECVVIVFGNKKGGCGKSITAVNLAGVITNAGESVCIIDADTNLTAVKYLKRRNIESEKREAAGKQPLRTIYSDERHPDDRLVREIRSQKALYNYIIVDTGGYENDAFKSAITIADIVYMPFQACQTDLEQLKPTIHAIKGIEAFIQNERDEDFQIDCRLLVTRVDSRSRDLLTQARETCRALLKDVSISNCIISEVKEVRKCQYQGVTLSDPVFEKGRPHPKRAMYELLFDEIKGNRKVKYERERKPATGSSNSTNKEVA